MNYEQLQKKLKQLDIEDFIWVIYIIIIFLSYYSNHLERRYYVNNDKVSKEKYRKIIIIIFLVLVVVYLYFLNDAYKDFKSLNIYDSKNKKQLVTLSFTASLLIAISGFIFLYIAVKDEDLNVELAFN